MFEYAVSCDSINVTFDQPILCDLNLKIPPCSIYGLVGSSGCGKTTLIRCIWGYIKPNSGTIRTLGFVPNVNVPQSVIPGPRMSYMPQGVCLDTCLTAHEVLIFFGKCHGITRTALESKIDSFCDILKISNLTKSVNSLSGGEQRRLSFVCSVLHEPELLLLDEPTVGSDPIARDAIWKYLKLLRDEKGATILVTTHYTDELISANTIGYLKNGKIQIEVDPLALRKEIQFRNLSLGGAINSLFSNSHQSNISLAGGSSPSLSSPHSSDPHEVPRIVSCKTSSDIRDIDASLFRYKKLTLKQIVIPMMMLVFQNTLAYFLLSNLYAHFTQDTLRFGVVDPLNQSNAILNVYPMTLTEKIFLQDEQEAIKKAESTQITGYLLFSDEFQPKFREYVECLYRRDPSCIGNHVGIVRYRGDYANKVIADYADHILFETFQNYAHNLSVEIYGHNREIDFIETKALIDSKEDGFYSKSSHSVLWRMMSHLAFAYSQYCLAFIFCEDKLQSMSERQQSMGFKRKRINIFQIIWCSVMICILITLLYAIMIFLIRPEAKSNNHLLLLFALYIVGITSVIFTYTLVQLNPNLTFLLLVNLTLVITGFGPFRVLWSEEFFPYYMKISSHMIPSPAAGDIVESLMLRGQDMYSSKIFNSFIELFIHLFVHIFIALRF